MLVLESDWLVLPGGKLEKGPVYVVVKGDRIAGVHKERASISPEGSEQSYFMHAHLVTPGFVDIHTHGVGGSDDALDYWLNPAYTKSVFPQHGTTSFLATMVFPTSHPSTPHTFTVLRDVVGKVGGGAVLEGVHAEGPIVHDLGAMPPSDAAMELDEFECFLDSIPGLRVMTISPHMEAKGGYHRIKALLKRGVLPSLGHDRVASEDEILGALSLSPQRRMHITHLFNVSSFHHRSPSLVNFGLTEDFPELSQYKGLHPPTVELIGDLAHVHPMVLSTVLKARTFRNICFITDSVMEPRPGATIRYAGREMQVSDDGRTLFSVPNEVGEGGGVLAGSCCSMVEVFRNLVNVMNVPVGEAVAMLAENPARITGLTHIGTVEVGKRADLLLFDDNLNLNQTIIAGTTEYKRTRETE